MAQFLDKDGLQYYTNKIKTYIQSQTTTGISKTEADKLYVAKTDLTAATTSKDGLMSSDDKTALDTIVEKKTDNIGDYYTLKNGIIPGTYYNITSFSGFVYVDEGSITLGSSATINQDQTVYNKTTNTFIGKTAAGKYFSNMKDSSVQGVWNTKGCTPYSDHLYIDSTTGVVYKYNGTGLADIHSYISETAIDEMFK